MPATIMPESEGMMKHSLRKTVLVLTASHLFTLQAEGLHHCNIVILRAGGTCMRG